MKLALVLFILLAAGCVQNINNYVPAMAAYGTLAEKWNNVSENFTAFSVDGKPFYAENTLASEKAPCDGKMVPAFACGDVIIAVPAKDVAADDIVSFAISDSDAAAFSEKQGGTIWRRVARIDEKGYVMKADALENTHSFFVQPERLEKKMIGLLVNAKSNAGMEKVQDNGNLDTLSELTKRWDSFVFSVFEGKTPDGRAFFYSRNLTSVNLMCTGSMKPNIDCGDLVLETAPHDLKKGDIIGYRIAPNGSSGFLPSSSEEQYIMHRIYRIDEKGYITKGDNSQTNDITDAIYIQQKDILGKVAVIMKNSFDSSVRRE